MWDVFSDNSEQTVHFVSWKSRELVANLARGLKLFVYTHEGLTFPVGDTKDTFKQTNRDTVDL